MSDWHESHFIICYLSVKYSVEDSFIIGVTCDKKGAQKLKSIGL